MSTAPPPDSGLTQSAADGLNGFKRPLSRRIRARARMRDRADPAVLAAEASQRSGNGACAEAPAIDKDSKSLPDWRDNDLDDCRLLTSAAAEIYAMRRARDRYMPDGLASEPAWDMLLALYSEEPSKLPVSSLCYGSGVPMTTALRWIAVLESRGLVERTRHNRDRRINLLSLTSKGSGVVERCLRAILRAAQR